MKIFLLFAAFFIGLGLIISELHGQEIVEGSSSGIRESSRPFGESSSVEPTDSGFQLAEERTLTETITPTRYALIPAFVGAKHMLNGGVTIGYRSELFGKSLWLRLGYSRTEVSGASGDQALSTAIRLEPISNQQILGIPGRTSLAGAISYRRRFNTSSIYRVEASMDQGVLGDVIALGGSIAFASTKPDGSSSLSDMIATPSASVSLGDFVFSYDYTFTNDVDGNDSYSITGTYWVAPIKSDTPIQAIVGYQKGDALFVNLKLLFRSE